MQRCRDDGAHWLPCEGAVGPSQERCDTPVDDDCDGIINEPDECACTVGQTRPCYSGPLTTRGVGACHDGVATCGSDGRWGPCGGEALPRTETVSPGDLVDEDCDGEVNEEGGACRPGTEYPCDEPHPYPSPCAQGGRRCLADGTGLGPCEGRVYPAANEICGNGIDDDCDGVPELNDGCTCSSGAELPCYTGPTLTRGKGACADGSRACDPVNTSRYGACVGETLPRLENCADPADEDCDGVAAPACSGVAKLTVSTAPAEMGAMQWASFLPSGMILQRSFTEGDLRIFDAAGNDVWDARPLNESIGAVSASESGRFAFIAWRQGAGMFLRSYDQRREPAWISPLPGGAFARALAAFDDGSIGVAGVAVFDPSSTGPKPWAPFVARYTSTGALASWRRLPFAVPPGGTYLAPPPVAWGSDGTAFVAMVSSGLAVPGVPVAAGLHVLRISAAGVVDWVRVLRTTCSNPCPLDIAVDGSNVWVLGSLQSLEGHGVALPFAAGPTALVHLDTAGGSIWADAVTDLAGQGLHVGGGVASVIGADPSGAPATVRFRAAGPPAYASRSLVAGTLVYGEPSDRLAVASSAAGLLTITVYDP